MATEKITLKIHHKLLEDIEVCAERSGMLQEEYILAAIREKNEKIKN